jgi:orotate phosphoribosyltransferase
MDEDRNQKNEETDDDQIQVEMLDLFRRLNAVIVPDHFVYASGKHGCAYVNKDAIYPHPHETSGLCLRIASIFLNSKVEVVLAPAVGGVILSHAVAHHLTALMAKEVLGVYADKSGDGFVIKRGYDKLIRGKRVLVVEDVLTTGGTVAKVVAAARMSGCNIIGVGALVNRGGVTEKDLGDVPVLHALLDMPMDSWAETDCPLCKNGVPVNVTLGKGADYVRHQKEMRGSIPPK